MAMIRPILDNEVWLQFAAAIVSSITEEITESLANHAAKEADLMLQHYKKRWNEEGFAVDENGIKVPLP